MYFDYQGKGPNLEPPPAPPAPPAPPSYIYDFNGTGTQVTAAMGLQAGLTTFDFTYQGADNFIVWLIDESANELELLANEIDSYSGSATYGVNTAGNYRLKIEHASGYWTAHIAQPRPASAPGVPQTFSGSGNKYTSFFTLNSGAAGFDMGYTGTSNFIVELKDLSGNTVEYLANEIGSWNGNTLENVAGGIYLLDVYGTDGSWSINVSQ